MRARIHCERVRRRNNNVSTKMLSASRSRDVWATVEAEFVRRRMLASALDHPPPSRSAPMKRIPVSRLSNDALIQELKESVAHDGPHTARQVALIAEVERRRLYAPAGYSSMYTYCLDKLHLSEDAAYKRIQVARVARRYPAVLASLAEGRVHLTGLNLLSAHFKGLDPSVVNELLSAAAHKTKKEIEQLLAERFPKPDLRAQVRAIPPVPPLPQGPAYEPFVGAPGQPQLVANAASELAPAQVGEHVTSCQTGPATCSESAERTRVAPLSAQRYGVQFTLDQAGHDLLRKVQDLLGHEVPRGDLAELFVRALMVYAAMLEKKKHAATENPRAPRRQKPGSRHISAHVKRVVWERDEGRCTHVSDTGHRCEASSDLEYDHVLEYARGGEGTVGNIRLRCRAHNRLGAERTYGAGFIERKQAEAVARRTARSIVGTRANLAAGPDHTPQSERPSAASAPPSAGRKRRARDSRRGPCRWHVLMERGTRSTPASSAVTSRGRGWR
jgi:hypothetical protein